MIKKSKILKEGRNQGLAAASKVISQLIRESFYDSQSGADMKPEYFEGRRNKMQTNAGELIDGNWETFTTYLEKALKKAVSSGEYDWLLTDYDEELDTRTDIVEANLMTMRSIASWVNDMNDFYTAEYKSFIKYSDPFDVEQLGEWDILKEIARDIDVCQPYGEMAEYEIYPLLDILGDNPRIFNSAPQSPGLDTLKSMVYHLKHDNYCIDEGVTANDIPDDWYRDAL